MHKKAIREIKNLTKPARVKCLKKTFCSEYSLIRLLFLISPILFYSMFMYIGHQLSDNAFGTDKWYSQTFAYILSILITAIDVFIAFLILIFMENPFSVAKDKLILRKHKPLLYFLCVFVQLTNYSFGVYTLYYEIKYIIEFLKTRDIVLASIGGTVSLVLNIACILRDEIWR